MWTIIKFDYNKIGLLKQDLQKKLGDDFKIYIPKFIIEKFEGNKKKIKEHNLLDDYLFCFSNSLQDPNIQNSLLFTRGLKHFFNGTKNYQKEISKFIDKCKESEDQKGYITKRFFDLYINSKYEFISGPFGSQIFEIINLQKNRIDILLNNIKVKINRDQYSFRPV